jgi:hypothetical protein
MCIRVRRAGSKKREELDYDEVYHSYTLYTLEDGSKWKMEKNAVVEAFPAKETDYKGELFDVPVGDRNLTLKGMIENASKGQESEFWKYRAGTNNCQAWTRDMIERNGLLSPVKEQDAQALVDTLPAGQTIPNLVTDAAATFDRVLHGDGISKQRKIRAALFSH